MHAKQCLNLFHKDEEVVPACSSSKIRRIRKGGHDALPRGSTSTEDEGEKGVLVCMWESFGYFQRTSKKVLKESKNENNGGAYTVFLIANLA